MEVENPSFMEEKELIVFPSSEVTNEEEYFTWEQKAFNKNNTKNPNKRRLVITTMSTEPILIEIRANLPEPIILPLMSNSTQCNIFEKECHCNRILCLEHMNLWNELYQIIHNSDTLKFSEECWFEKEDVVNDSFFDMAKRINCRELWPNICKEALDSIKHFKKEVEKEKNERERYALALTKFSDLEEQLEMEKNRRNQECHTFEALILELHNQVSKQAEEIRRLWTENLVAEGDSINLKLDENRNQEDALETKKHILELEHQLAEELKQHERTLTNEGKKCEFLQSKVDELENKNNAVLLDLDKCDNLKLKIEELEKEKLQYQEKVSLSIFSKDGDEKMLDYATLMKEYDILKEELEKVNNNYNRTTNKLRHNVAKRRRLEEESEGEKQQRSNLAAALYELESEVETTVLIINSLQSTTLESVSVLATDLQNFQEALEKCVDFNNFETNSSSHNDNDIIQDINEKSPIQNLEVTSSNVDNFKGIPDTRSIISKLTQGNEKLLNEISIVRIAIRKALKSQKRQEHVARKEMTTKLETMEAEKETFRGKTKVLDEENKSLEEENSKLQHEVSTLKFAKSKLTLELKDLEKDMEDLQENLKNLREENRRLLKEAKWKSVGKQGGYQESLIVQEWDKKLKKLEADYEILHRVKKDLVKEKHHLEDELERTVEIGYKGLGGSEDRKVEDELFNMIQERNKLRKIKITLAIENVSLKESLAELRTKADALETECETLREWKEKVKKLEEDCEDLRDWKSKAEALEVECKDLRDNQMKVEAYEIECKAKNSKADELGEECKKLHESIQDIGEECKYICHSKDCLEEECKNLKECKYHFEEECQKLRQSVDHLDKECHTLREFKENTENSNKNNELLDEDKMKVKILECEKSSGNTSKVEVELKNKILHQSNSMDVEHCIVQEYLEKIAKLKYENEILCQTHQAALDKQWDVLQVDLKAFEAKVEELESECESIRRDHLSSMVENAELTREKDRLLTLYNEQKYNYEILETANECLQKDREQKEIQQIREQNNYHTSIDNLNRQVLELESTFSKRLHQQATNYASCLAPKTKINGQETITLTRQEYEILLAEKAVMLQERDSAHKKLCSAEVQNLQLSASIECLRQEFPRENQGQNEKEIDDEVLLVQDVVNLRSILSSLEEELESANCARNKVLEVNTSLKEECNEIHEALLQCQHEKQNLNVAIEELKQRSSLEHIHSAASSLKEQLGKASKEKDLIKEQLNKVIKEREQLANVANERDNVIFSLREQIIKLEKDRDESCSSFKNQLQDIEDNGPVLSHVQDRLMTVVKERDNIKEELVALQQKLESLCSKMSLVENDLIKKTKLWQKEWGNLEEKCRRIEMELNNTKEALAMTKKTMQNDIEEAIKEKNNFELVTKKEIKDVQRQASQFHDELLRTKQFLSEKIELASKEMDNISIEKNILIQKIMELKENYSLLQKENDALISELSQCNKHTKDLVLPTLALKELNQSIPFIQTTLVEQDIQPKLQKNELMFETKETNHQVEQEATLSLNKQNDELAAVKKERDSLLETISRLKIEKDTESYHKEKCSYNCGLVQVSKCENNTDLSLTFNEEQDTQKIEKKMISCIEVTSLHQNLHDFGATLNFLNEQRANLAGEKNQVNLAKLSLMDERDHLLATVANLETEKETMTKKFEQDLHMEVSSVKALLTTTAKEKEQLATSEESLHKKLDNLCVTVQSLNEQLASLSYEKDRLVHAKEVVTLERDDLLEKISAFNKLEEIELKSDDSKSSEQLDGTRLVVCENVSTTHLQNEQYVDLRTEDIEQMENARVVTKVQELVIANIPCSLYKNIDGTIEEKKNQSKVRKLIQNDLNLNCAANKEEYMWITTEVYSQEQLNYLKTTISEMKVQYGELTNANSLLVQERECLIEEGNKLFEELSLLKNDKDIILEKKGKRRWNSKGSKEEIAMLLSKKEQLVASETFLKQQLVDFKEKESNKYSFLMNKKMEIFKDHENLIAEIALLNKEKEEIEKKLERISMQNTASLRDLQNALVTTEHDLHAKQDQYVNLMKDYARLKEDNVMLVQTNNNLAKEHENLTIEIALVKKDNEELKEKLTKEIAELLLVRSKLVESTSEKDRLAELELCLIHQLNILKANLVVAKGQQQTKLEGEIIVLSQTIKTLIQDNDKLVKEYEQHAQLQNDFSSLLKAKETLDEECNSLSKEMIILKSEKEILAKEYATILFEKEHIVASKLSLQAEVESLNKTLFSLNKQVVDLIEKNDKLHIELQTTAFVEARMSKDEEQQTCASIIFNTTELGILCNMEENLNELNVKFIKENKQPDIVLSPVTTTFPNAKLESLNNQLESIKEQKNQIIKERDNLTTSMGILKQKLDFFNEQQVQIAQERDNVLEENKSLQLQCDNLQAKISALKAEGDIMNSSAESKVTKHTVFKEKSQKLEITSLQTSMNILKEQKTYFSKENMEIALENEVLTKERNGLLASISLLKKQHEAIYTQELKKKETTTLEASLKQKFEELVQTVDALNKSQEGHASKKDPVMQAVESVGKKHDNLLESIISLEGEKDSLCSNVEHHLYEQMEHSMVVKEEELSKLQAFLRDRLDDLAKTTTSLIERFIATTKERDHLIPEITSLKRECQKLHMALVISERDKDTLMKKVMESRSTFDRYAGEINRLQRELANVEMKLHHTIVERNNAKLQIADLQKLLSNQQRVQHLPIPYSMEKVETLEAKNKYLRMEKNVLEECLNKRSMELEENHRFQQKLPSMTNFNCMNSHPPPRPLLHASSQLYSSGPDPLGRPQPPLLSMLHQQWPM